MAKILIFAGTSEGRELAEWLLTQGVQVSASVTTHYGESLLPPGVEVFSHPMGREEMAALLQRCPFACVVDATHPYASQATGNIRAACAQVGMPYLRLLRPSQEGQGGRYVATHAQAVGATAVVIGRPLREEGLTLGQLQQILKERYL